MSSVVSPRAACINQPALFPWIGEFEKIAVSTVSVCLDSVAFQKRGYLTRFRMLSDGGPKWVTLSSDAATKHGSIVDVVVDVTQSESNGWFRRLNHWYRRSPYRPAMLDMAQQLLRPGRDRAVDRAEESLVAAAAYLGVGIAERCRSSAMGVNTVGSKLNRDLVMATGSTRYVFGPGRRGISDHYLDTKLLETSGIRCEVMAYQDVPYEQGRLGVFVPRCSVLDAIAWLGPATASLVVSESVDSAAAFDRAL